MARLQLLPDLLDQFLDGIVSLYISRFNLILSRSLVVAAALRGDFLGRRLLCGLRRFGARLGRRFCGLLGGRLLLCGLRCLVVALARRAYHRLLTLWPRADARLVVVGQDLGDPQHRDLVAVPALAARVLAAALLERDDLGTALVL